MGFIVSAELVWRCLQACGAPASDFAGLAALFHEKVEGEARGGRGLLIGSAGTQIKHAVKGIEGGGVTPAVSSEREGEEFPGKKNLTRWSHLSARKKRKRKRKRKSEEGGCGMRPAGLVRWLLGWSGSWVGPVAAFHFFFCPGSFCFCFLFCFKTFVF
jgi:hypothetical protein